MNVLRVVGAVGKIARATRDLVGTAPTPVDRDAALAQLSDWLKRTGHTASSEALLHEWDTLKPPYPSTPGEETHTLVATDSQIATLGDLVRGDYYSVYPILTGYADGLDYRNSTLFRSIGESLDAAEKGTVLVTFRLQKSAAYFCEWLKLKGYAQHRTQVKRSRARPAARPRTSSRTSSTRRGRRARRAPWK